MNVIFSTDFTGPPDADDQLAAKYIVALENKRRAALDPPGTPLPANTGAALKASYLLLLVEIETRAHQSYIDQAKAISALQADFTPAQVQTIVANLTERLRNGESAASIVSDTAAL